MTPLAEMDNIEVEAGVKGKSRISFWSFQMRITDIQVEYQVGSRMYRSLQPRGEVRNEDINQEIIHDLSDYAIEASFENCCLRE